MDKATALNIALNLKCSETQKPITVGELVKIHNWGSTNEVIGYGHFEWDEHERNFYFVNHDLLNSIFNIENPGVDSSYDLFRTSPAKLNKEELKLIK